MLSCWIFLVGREILSASLRWWCQKGHSRHKSTVSRVGVRPDYSRSFPKGQVLLQCVPNSIQRATTLDTLWCKRMQIVIIIALNLLKLTIFTLFDQIYWYNLDAKVLKNVDIDDIFSNCDFILSIIKEKKCLQTFQRIRKIWSLILMTV